MQHPGLSTKYWELIVLLHDFITRELNFVNEIQLKLEENLGKIPLTACELFMVLQMLVVPQLYTERSTVKVVVNNRWTTD